MTTPTPLVVPNRQAFYATDCILGDTIASNAYINAISPSGAPPLSPPFPFSTIVTIDSSGAPNSVLYTIDMANNPPSAELSYQILIDFTVPPFRATVSDVGQFMTVTVSSYDPHPTPSSEMIITMVLTNRVPSIFPLGSFNDGDQYTITINSLGECNGNGMTAVIARYIQPIINPVNDRSTSLTTLNTLNTLSQRATSSALSSQRTILSPHCACSPTGSLVRVPNITIIGQTTAVFGNNLSDFTFNVQDTKCYRKHKHATIDCKKEYDCNTVVVECKTKTTSFFEFDPPMRHVIKGKGCNLRDKVLDIYYSNQPATGPSFDVFYNDLIYYTMLQYFLSRLLYGKFDMNVLCQNNNKQFMCDLKHSRFCYYYYYLKNPDNGFVGFQHYFKKCC